MELIERTNVFIATVLRVLVDGTLERWVQDGFAAIDRFWNTNPNVASGIPIAQLFAALLCVVFAFIIFIALERRFSLVPASGASEKAAQEPSRTGPFQERWKEIVLHLDSPHEAEWKLAVIEADALSDEALGRAGFSGETFGDRLTNIKPGVLVSLDGLWWAHKIRNRIVHEADYFLRYTEARQAIGYYQQSLEELQLL